MRHRNMETIGTMVGTELKSHTLTFEVLPQKAKQMRKYRKKKHILDSQSWSQAALKLHNNFGEMKSKI